MQGRSLDLCVARPWRDAAPGSEDRAAGYGVARPALPAVSCLGAGLLPEPTASGSLSRPVDRAPALSRLYTGWRRGPWRGTLRDDSDPGLRATPSSAGPLPWPAGPARALCSWSMDRVGVRGLARRSPACPTAAPGHDSDGEPARLRSRHQRHRARPVDSDHG